MDFFQKYNLRNKANILIKKEFKCYGQKSKILVETFLHCIAEGFIPQELNPSTNTLAKLVSSTFETKTHVGKPKQFYSIKLERNKKQKSC